MDDMGKELGMTKVFEYTEELGTEICEAIAQSSEGLKSLIRQNPHWPRYATVRKWIRINSAFADLYARAKLDQADLLVEEILEISDDKSRDNIVKINSEGEEYEVCNSEWVNRSRLRVDTRKWLASKLAPKLYGERNTEKQTDGKSYLEDNIDKL